jgi:Uri superfamily endonuclease
MRFDYLESKTCYVCEKTITEKNEISLNLKLLGRSVTRFYCCDCLADSFEITTQELLAKIEEFKMQGYKLFG